MAVTNSAVQVSQTRLKVWGTSRAVRIPKRMCEQLGITAESVLIMEQGEDVRGPYLMLRPAEGEHRSFSDAPFASMDELFAGYEGEYVPVEADWGEDIGHEVVA